MVIEIAAVNGGGVAVNVSTSPFSGAATPDLEGAAWAGLCQAINEHMRSRGCPGFDCMRAQLEH